MYVWQEDVPGQALFWSGSIWCWLPLLMGWCCIDNYARFLWGWCQILSDSLPTPPLVLRIPQREIVVCLQSGQWSVSPLSSQMGYLLTWPNGFPGNPVTTPSATMSILLCIRNHFSLWESWGTELRLSQLSFSYTAWCIIVPLHSNKWSKLESLEGQRCREGSGQVNQHLLVSEIPTVRVKTLG